MNVQSRTKSWSSRVGVFVACVLPCVPSANGKAQSCERDADCPDKFSCEVSGSVDCPPSKDCPEGDECPTPEDCEPSEYRSCVSPSCKVDGDCPSGMVCYEQTWTQCSGTTPSCRPNEECPEPTDAGAPECEERSERSCVPRYVPPCTEAADCGAGFTCEERIISMCSGGAGKPAADAGQATPPDSETHCTTMATGELHCVLQTIECTDDGDCPERFSCEEGPNRSTCVDTGPAGAGASLCPDASSSSAKVCLPPYRDVAGLDEGGQHGGSSENDADASTAVPAIPTTTKKDSSGCSAAPARQGGGSAQLVLCALLASLIFAHCRRRSLRRQESR